MASLNNLAEDFVPGTVHLIDVEGTLKAKHASGARHDVVLVPTPSSDPDDPLNWTPRRKLLATACMSVYTVMVGIASAAIYSVLVPISLDTGISLGDLNAGTGYMFLFFGWGTLIWQPLALQYGKRPIYMASIAGTMAIMVWAPHARTVGQWHANKILQGFFGAPIESLVEASVTDVYFTHQRGSYLALYAMSLAGSSFFAPIIAGFIADGQGWPWVLYWCAIFCAIGFVFLAFFMEETNYERKGSITGQEPMSTDRSQTPSLTTEDPAKQGEKVTTTTAPSDIESSEGTVSSKPIKTYLAKLRLFQPGVFSKPVQLLGMATRPLVFLSFPVIAYAGFSYGSNLVWFNVLNGTAALILTEKPYSFSASLVGVAYTSPLIGVLVGSVLSGHYGDRFMLYMARRNGGTMEPEHRLWIFLFSLVMIPFGLLLWGVGAAHHVHWFGLVFAMGVIAATNAVGLQVSVSYAIDSYRDLAGEAIITVILIRNTMSFAINYGLTPWVTNMGLQNAFILAAFAGLAQVLTFLIFVKWGKKWRRDSRDRYLKYVDKIRQAGLGH